MCVCLLCLHVFFLCECCILTCARLKQSLVWTLTWLLAFTYIGDGYLLVGQLGYLHWFEHHGAWDVDSCPAFALLATSQKGDVEF